MLLVAQQKAPVACCATGALFHVYNGSLLFLDHIQTLSFHLEFRISEPHTFQQEIPVNPSDNRFGGVVEIDSVGFPEA
jgi:hypothetical protein